MVPDWLAFAATTLLLMIGAGCVADDGPAPSPSPTSSAAETYRTAVSGPFKVSSSAFANATAIPPKYSCDSDNVSPPLAFTNAPAEATYLALIMEDPDAPRGTVLHWTFWNLPTNVSSLPEDAAVPAHGAREGQEYRGPCPPVGTHRYFFYAYATDGPLDLEGGSSVSELRAALRGHARAEAQMHGTYMRPQIPTYAPGPPY